MNNILCGVKQKFAIECQVEKKLSQRWIYGRFRFWIHSQSVGDWGDFTVLTDNFYHLKEFIEKPQSRMEPGLDVLSKEDLFAVLCDNVVTNEARDYQFFGEEIYPNTYNRFHINYLGSTAFDTYEILLLETSTFQRIVWRMWRETDSDIIFEATFAPYTIQDVAKEFCLWFEQNWLGELETN